MQAAVKSEKKLAPNPRLRKARVDRGWTQQDLADQLGTTKINISRWENGANSPSPYFRHQLSEVFGKTHAELGLTPAAPRINNVPIAHSPFFTGRQDLLALLHRRLSRARKAALTQAQALYGLGGIGKTQTAAEYAFRFGDDYAHVFWIWAASRETLIADFVELAEFLDLPEKHEQDQRRVVTAVRRWLAANDGWLLIMDNADDLRLAQEFLPTGHKGYVLFTTRAQAAGAIAASIEVVQLTEEEGTLLLLHWTRLLDVDSSLNQAQEADFAAALRIVQEMGGLPLALVQAGAYIEETGCSLEDYLDLYATRRLDLLGQRSHLFPDYPETVATTWSLSFRLVEEYSPAAADLLRVCAFLAPDAIPEALLTRGAAELGPVLGAAASDPFKLNAALEVLRRYSLVRREGRSHLLTIHRLVQTVLRESMDEAIQRAWAERAVRAVSAAFPEDDSHAGATRRDYLPHVQECAALIERYYLAFPEAAQLLLRAGATLYYYGLHAQARTFHEQALTMRKQLYGSEHPAVAESLNALAILARLRGDYTQAEAFHRQALAIREKMLGSADPWTAESLNNLGVLYRNQGKYDLAEPLLRQAFDIREKTLGPEHGETLISATNLAKLYTEQREYEQAEHLLQQALAAAERVFKPSDHLIAHTLNQLARLAYEQRDFERAEALWKRSLAILEQTLGVEHPATAEVLDDLAQLWLTQGHYAQALSLCERALSIAEKLLGSDYPDTTAYREHLARIESTRKEAEQDGDHHPAPPRL